MKYKVHTWVGGYMTISNEVEASNDTEALWLGVDEAIRNNNILFVDVDDAVIDYDDLPDDEKHNSDDYFDYYTNYLGYTYHDNSNDFIGFVCLENARVEEVSL